MLNLTLKCFLSYRCIIFHEMSKINVNHMHLFVKLAKNYLLRHLKSYTLVDISKRVFSRDAMGRFFQCGWTNDHLA